MYLCLCLWHVTLIIYDHTHTHKSTHIQFEVRALRKPAVTAMGLSQIALAYHLNAVIALLCGGVHRDVYTFTAVKAIRGRGTQFACHLPK